MLYLLDANVFIDANRDYYPLARVPEFWEWLVDRASGHHVKIPLEMYEEILAGKEDDLTCWLKDNRDVLLLDEHVNETLVARVTCQGYAPNLSDEEIERGSRRAAARRGMATMGCARLQNPPLRSLSRAASVSGCGMTGYRHHRAAGGPHSWHDTARYLRQNCSLWRLRLDWLPRFGP